MTIADKTVDDVNVAIDLFYKGWDRHKWMQDNGEWASSQWDAERQAYDEAVIDLKTAMESIRQGDYDYRDNDAACDAVAEALEAVREAASALDGAVSAELDYIAEGTIDPDCVADTAEPIKGTEMWQGRDRTEGYSAYRAGNALVFNWWRNAYGNRLNRDLWVVVDAEFFSSEVGAG